MERASTEAAVVDYGSDINTAQYASGFETLCEERSWDLRHLATLPGSLLSKVRLCWRDLPCVRTHNIIIIGF